MERGNKVILAGVVLLGVVFGLAYPHVRQLRFKMAVQDTVLKLGRFPTVPDVLALEAQIKASGEKLGLKPEEVKVKLSLTEQQAGPVSFFFLRADVDYGRQVGHSRKLNSDVVKAEFLEGLQKAGVQVTLLAEDDKPDLGLPGLPGE